MKLNRSRLIAAAVCAASLMLAMPGAPAQVPSVTQGSGGGQGPTGSTAITYNIPATSTTVTLTAVSSYITIVNLSNATTLYYSPVSPATTSSFAIAPSSAYSYNGSGLTQFYVIGSAASGQFSVSAH